MAKYRQELAQIQSPTSNGNGGSAPRYTIIRKGAA